VVRPTPALLLALLLRSLQRGSFCPPDRTERAPRLYFGANGPADRLLSGGQKGDSLGVRIGKDVSLLTRYPSGRTKRSGCRPEGAGPPGHRALASEPCEPSLLRRAGLLTPDAVGSPHGGRC